MENMTQLRKRRAVSPVIATVILVAVTITVAVAVAYWMSGIAGQYTRFEKVEIQSAWSEYDATVPEKWTVTLELKNSGTADAMLISVFINDKPIDGTLIDCVLIDPIAVPPVKLLMPSGVSQTVLITILDDVLITYSSGTTINVKLHSAAGMDYIRLVELV